MSWKRKKLRKGRNTYYSLCKKLRQEKRSNDEFETMLANLSLEEVIGLKLELATKPGRALNLQNKILDHISF
jgi:hypothetical protein